MQICANKVFKWTNNILAGKLSTPVHIIIEEHTRLQGAIQLVEPVLKHRWRGFKHDFLAKDEVATSIFMVPLKASNLLIRRLCLTALRDRIGVNGVTFASPGPETVWQTSLRQISPDPTYGFTNLTLD